MYLVCQSLGFTLKATKCSCWVNATAGLEQIKKSVFIQWKCGKKILTPQHVSESWFSLINTLPQCEMQRETARKFRNSSVRYNLHACLHFLPAVASKQMTAICLQKLLRNTQRCGKAPRRACFSTCLPFSFLSLFNHCLKFPTFFSVTWATNQVPGF